ncbi:MAG: hypothetical protein HY737_04360 [Candidatus Omnitrophica bacterium]|nr:hypothetical protein [Candidatus Omnitrophota bacterium]
MPTYVVSGLIVTIGVLSVGIGVLLARHMVHDAQRVHGRILSRSTGVLEGWDARFVGGFAQLAMGCSWLWAAAAWFGWTLVGMSCIGLGVHVLTKL